MLIAPDSFKGTISASDAAAAIARGWVSVRPADELVLMPQADGGEGTLEVLARVVDGAEWRTAGAVEGPDGRSVTGVWVQLPDGTAVVELAQSCGLTLMDTPDALGASTYGLGQVIAAALDRGATSLVIALGGSASTDGGAGALTALGLELRDGAGHPVGRGGGALGGVASVTRSGLRSAPAGGVRLLADVDAPLLGATGAAATFGPQKGATPVDVRALDASLSRFADLMRGDPTHPGAGAAGGTAFGFMAAWGATIEPGAVTVAELTGLVAATTTAELIVTGEGRFDSQSLGGKVVGNTLRLASEAGCPARVIAGQLAHDIPAPHRGLSLESLACSASAAMATPARWLEVAGAEVAREFPPAPTM